MWVRIVIGLTFAVFEGGFSLWALAGLGLNPRDIAFVLAYVGVISVVIQLGLIGPLTKRRRDPQLIVGATALAAVMLVAWGALPNIWTLLALLPFLSLGMALANTIVGSALTKAVHPDEVGGIIGLSTSVGSLTRISPHRRLLGRFCSRQASGPPACLPGSSRRQWSRMRTCA